jgi:hypothetical protein
LFQVLEAAFLAEHMVSKFNFHEMLERSLVCRAGPIGLMEVRMLGGELRATAQAELLGRALPMMQWHHPVEREILALGEAAGSSGTSHACQ